MNPPYQEILAFLHMEGLETPSRYGPTREAVGVNVKWVPGEMVARVGANPALGFMELMQILAGDFDLDAIERVAPKAELSLFTRAMSYGPRIAEQVPGIIAALENDSLTRQAVLYIGKPEDGPTPAQPCTTCIQYIVREGKLVSLATMRSWDVVKGLTYDVVFQGGLAMAVARCLDVEAAVCLCSAGSFHMYEADAAKQALPGRVDRFQYTRAVPKTWPGIVEWAHGQVATMDRVPDGIEVVSNRSFVRSPSLPPRPVLRRQPGGM